MFIYRLFFSVSRGIVDGYSYTNLYQPTIQNDRYKKFVLRASVVKKQRIVDFYPLFGIEFVVKNYFLIMLQIIAINLRLLF